MAISLSRSPVMAVMALLLMVSSRASGQDGCTGGPTVYTCTDEAAFLARLAQSGSCSIITEGYEDSAGWGAARFTATQPAVVSRGITWAANNAAGGITTSGGAARSGNYGVFAYPHGITTGTPFTVQRDGFTGNLNGSGTMIGAGGWISSNTPGAQVRFVIDGQEVGFEDPLVPAGHKFFGVIRTTGFTAFEVYEREGRVEDQKQIFGDDFTICSTTAFINSPPYADNQAVRTQVSTPVPIFLSGTDPNGDLLTYSIIGNPANGDLTGTPPNLVYTPDPGFAGSDSFTFRVNDGNLNSDAGTVSILVDLSQKTFYFPQFVDGSAGSLGYWSTLILSNTAADSSVRIEFFTTNGRPMSIELGSMGQKSVFDLVLLRGESVSLSTPGDGALKAGYARVTAGNGVDGVLVFTGYDTSTGVELYETGVASTTPLHDFSLFVDSLQNHDTGVAVVFPRPAQPPPAGVPPAVIKAKLYDNANNLIAEKTLDPLPAGGYFAAFVYQLFEGGPGEAAAKEMEGLLTIESNQPLAAVTLRQDSPSEEFPLKMPALTTFPIIKGRP